MTGSPPHLRPNALSLRIPEPKARPGEMLDFGDLRLSPAGEVPRPPIDVDQAEIRTLAYKLIRVLDDEGQAVGPWAPGLSADVLRQGLRAMMLTRAFDDAHADLAQRQGKTSFYMQSLGEEAVATAHRDRA